ncbi:DUF2141 domain-containing protein [bacterium]|nr:DUF2141 domain-containing protein [bacterium]
MKKTLTTLVIVFLLINAPLSQEDTGKAESIIKGRIIAYVNNLRNEKGLVRMALFNSPDGFPKDKEKVFRSAQATIKDGTSKVVYDNLPYGTYAIVLLHDENLDDDMNYNFLGIPKEGYGASNDAVRKFAAPKFEDAKFMLEADSLVLNITAQYWL